MNAEKFIETRNAHNALIQQMEATVEKSDNDNVKKTFKSLQNKGSYLSVRGSNNFVKYTYRLNEVNSSLRHLLAELATVLPNGPN